MKLGRLGVWYPPDRMDRAQMLGFLALVESAGYDTFWYGEARKYEAMALAGFLLANSKKVNIAAGIANTYARDAVAARNGLYTLTNLFGDRYILGLGVGHKPTVEGFRGHAYEKPFAMMKAYLETFALVEPNMAELPLVLAALGPQMLALSAKMTHGALPYNVTPAYTKEAAGILGPGKWLAVEQKVCLETDPAKARKIAHGELAPYLKLPNYRNNMLRMGFTEAELADTGSDRLMDAMVLHGDANTIKKGLRAHFEAGATHVCIQPVHEPGDWAARDRVVEALADT